MSAIEPADTIQLLTESLAASEAKVTKLRNLLLTARCPGDGWNGMPDDIEPTVKDCMAATSCGCDYGDALAETEPQAGPASGDEAGAREARTMARG